MEDSYIPVKEREEIALRERECLNLIHALSYCCCYPEVASPMLR
ncbi:unnamed protein product [Arabidopsis halleri]